MDDAQIEAAGTGQPDGPRGHWTSVHDANGTRWYRHTWPVAAARDGLVDAFLAADPGDKAGWMGSPMRVVDDTGAEVAVVVDPDRYRKLVDAAGELTAKKETPPDAEYHPAVHGPGSGGDGMLIDTDPIRVQLAWLLAKIELGDDANREAVQVRAAEIETKRSSWLVATAVLIALQIKLLAGHDGVVPIRCWSSPTQGAETEARWHLAYQTPARGLYVRGGDPNLFGEEYDVVSGSGYRLRSGFVSREVATDYAVAIAAAAPDVDWRVWDTPLAEAPPAILDPVAAENKRWWPYGPRPVDPADASDG
jgi:hypothetical protein